MKQKLAAAGIPVPPGNEGDMEGQGVKAHFKWDGAANLTITITDKPWYASCGMIIGKIQDFVHSCGGTNLSSRLDNHESRFADMESRLANLENRLKNIEAQCK
jgi:hypothetical protein